MTPVRASATRDCMLRWRCVPKPTHRISAALHVPALLGSLTMQLLEAAAANGRLPTPADVAPVAGHHIGTILLPA